MSLTDYLGFDPGTTYTRMREMWKLRYAIIPYLIYWAKRIFPEEVLSWEKMKN